MSHSNTAQLAGRSIKMKLSRQPEHARNRALSKGFSKLAVFDARLDIRVRRLDQSA